MNDRVQAIFDFWFGGPDVRGQSRKEWFQKVEAFDEAIRTQFLADYELAAAGQYENWLREPVSCVSLAVVLDQFPRNMFRGSARAFATDAKARDVARHAIAKGFDQQLLPVERSFLYLPLEHSESLADQVECVALMKTLSVFPETKDLHIWAEKHRVIVERFGRFPHRNAALGRESTPEEIEFLKQPGSGF